MLRSRAGAMLALAACGRIDFDPQPIGTLVVEPTYASAPGWNDYVRRELPAQRPYLQPGTRCDGSETGPFTACIQAGVQRRAVLGTLSTCAGVTATDSLGALQWRCDDSSGTAIVYSTGLRGGAGLGDLLDAAGWRPEQLRVSIAGGQTAESDPTTWWTDSVIALPDAGGSNVVALDRPGTIYVLAASRAAPGYNIAADGIALVTLPGVTLSYAMGGINCDDASGEITNANQRCIVAAGDQRFVWIEGTFDALDVASYGVLGGGLRFSQLRRTHATSARLTAVVLIGGSSNALTDVTGANSHIYGVAVDGTNDNVLRDIQTFGNGLSQQTGNAGLIVGDGASGNVTTRLVIANNFDYGLLEYAGTLRNTYSHVTVGNEATGIDIQGNGSATVVQALVVNANMGLRFDSDANLASQGAVAHGTIGICPAGAGSRLEHNFLIGNESAGDCRTGSLCSAILDCTTIAGTPIVTMGFDASTALRYKVTNDDASNTSDVAGQASPAAITDWIHFDSPLRGWGVDGGMFPDPTNQSFCTGTCRIWDWRRQAGDGSIIVRDEAGAQDTTTVRAGAPCPASVDGDFTVTDMIGNTFLANALELLGDGAGDDDGLCETGEACVRSGYVGADQGWQDSYGAGTCLFRDGRVSGVEMHGP